MFFWISTAVACRAGNTCTMYCWMEDPSLEAKYLSSARAARKPKAAKTLGSFLMMSVALCIRSSFSSTATANGSFSNVDLQRSVYALVGASWTGLACSAELAFATTTASRVMRAISSAVTSGEPPLTLGDDPHAEAEVLLIGDERNFVGFVSAAVRRKAVARELLAVAGNADVAVAGPLLARLGERHFGKLFERGVRFGCGSIGSAEQPVREQNRASGGGRQKRAAREEWRRKRGFHRWDKCTSAGYPGHRRCPSEAHAAPTSTKACRC